MVLLRLGGRRKDRDSGGDAVFDPYYKWLGIRPEHQPPDHYRLLGLDTFESDADVIQAAAERQMAHIQSYKIGPQSDLSQRVLNEIAKAKVCLISPESKSEYDRGLRERSKQPEVVAPPINKPSPLTQTSTIDDVTPLVPRTRGGYRPSRGRNRNRSLGTAISLGCVGLILVAIVGAILFKGKAPPELSKKSVPPTVPSLRELQRPNSTSATRPKPAMPSIPAPPSESAATPSPDLESAPDPTSRLPARSNTSPFQEPAPDLVPRLPAPNAEQLTASPQRDTDSLPPGYLMTPSGKDWPLETNPTTASIVKDLFPNESRSIFVLRRNSSPIGLFIYTNSKFDGPAIVLYPNGLPKILLSFAEHSRDGLLQHWNLEGELQFSATYKNGRKLGLSVIYQNGRPHLIEEWDTSKSSTKYIVENHDAVARLVKLEGAAADKGEHSKMIARIEQLEQELFREEGEWKREFSEWWRRHDNEIKKLERAIALGRSSWQQKLNNYYDSIQAESRQGRESVLSSFFEPTAVNHSGSDLQTDRGGIIRQSR